MSKYLLYYTLNRGVKSTDLNPKQKEALLQYLKDISNDQKKAIILLIAEHSRVVDGHEFDTKNMVLPYNIYEDVFGVHIDINLLPNELKWVLHKFSLMSLS
jgi:hypothetical protein